MGLIKRSGLVFAGRYRLVQPIGAGGMGAVWVADDLQLRSRVALKFMLDEQPDVRGRFVREARLSKRLSHPNIVKLLDVGESNTDEPFLVLELLSGETLDRHLKALRRIPPREAVRIIRDVARAVEAAHAAQIMHRDLKPANVFLHDERGPHGEEFVVKVLDFGVAKSLSSADETYATALGVVVGSPAYMSPEQLIGRVVDHRTDIWAMGIMLFELIVGERPFIGSRTDVANQVLVGTTPSMCARMRGVPDEVDRVVMLCLERSRDKRIATASELESMLHRIWVSDEVWRAASAGASTNVSEADQARAVSQSDTSGTGDVVARDEPAVSQTASKRRREARLMMGVSIGLLAVAIVMILLGVAFGLSTNETETNSTPAGSAPIGVAGVASTNSFADKPSTEGKPKTVVTLASAPIGISSQTPTGAATSLPPCSASVVVGCRNVGKQGNKAEKGSMPNPYGSRTSTGNAGSYVPSKI